jgi:Ca-activated chloride channel family protein
MKLPGRKFTGLLFWFCVCVSRLAASPQQAGQSAATIHVAVERVNVGVIVTDPVGHFVEDLQRENFHVLDNGVPQPISAFASVEQPGQVLLLVESGPAVYLLESVHLRAAVALLNGLSADDRIAIVSYAEAPTPILDFTSDKNAAGAALDQLQFNLGVGQLNLCASIDTILDWLARVSGKKTIVLLSTGVDTSPEATITNLLARLRLSDVRVLAVSLGGALETPKPAVKSKKTGPKTALALSTSADFREAGRLLNALASSSGGRTYFPSSAEDFRYTYAEIAQLVRHEYSLAFIPPRRDAAAHSIEVRVTPASSGSNAPPPTYRVDHRQAYLAPAPQ